jgi:hypothetical protein
MRTPIHLLTAACLATSAFLFAAPVNADTTVTSEKTVVTSNDHGNLMLPGGITAKDLNADKGVERAFKGVAEYAFSTTGFDNIVGYLVDQDRDRIKKSTDKSLNDLDGNHNKALKDAVNNISATFDKKYGKKFDIDYKKDFGGNFIQVMTGEVSDPSLLVGKWPLSNLGTDMGGKVTGSDAQQAKNKMFGGDVNLEKGRDVAIAHLMASHGMPAVTASMIQEHASGWHFDIPNNIDAQTLYNTVVANLNYMNNNADKWPADISDAHRAITHGVVASLYNIDLSKMPKNTTANERP